MSRPAAASQDTAPAIDQAPVDPAEQRHLKLLRMLGHLKNTLAFPLSKRELVRAICMAGYNANPNQNISGADGGSRALWADEDAEALLAVGSDEEAP